MVVREQCGTLTSVGETPSRDPRQRLFVLSDIRLLREGLVLALSKEPSVLALGSSDFSLSPTVIAELRPDIILLDAAKLGNLELSLSLRQVLPGSKIVAFAVADIDDDIIACAEAGVSGYVSCTGSIEDVVAAVHGAVSGQLHCTPRTSALLFRRMALPPARRSPVAGHEVLTQREREIVALLEQGLSNKEIGRFLRIGYATVKNHVHSILGKLQVRRRAEVSARIRRADTRTRQITGFFSVFTAASGLPDWLWVHRVCAEGLERVVAAVV
jgi:two-component system nitrate/nitrite response regulator NarL